MLGHHLEQRRLDLGRGPVDLVGEDEVGEHGPELDVEGLARRPVDAGADEVGGQEVGRELEAGEGAAADPGEGLADEGLGQAGHALEQAVAARQEAHDQALDGPVLADDDLLDLEDRGLEALGVVGGGAGRVHGRRRLGARAARPEVGCGSS